MFSKYSTLLQREFAGKSIVHYISSHDDGGPYDLDRKDPINAGTKLLLCPGAVQVYYGDETNRPLVVEGTEGDANLRSFMNWSELQANQKRNGFAAQDVLAHWQKLGRFRRAHLAVGAGVHTQLSDAPYTFKRVHTSGSIQDQVGCRAWHVERREDTYGQGCFSGWYHAAGLLFRPAHPGCQWAGTC